MVAYDRRVIGNEYYNPKIDERFVVTDLQNWGTGYGVMIMRYEDNVEWDEAVGFLDECELVQEGTLPITMDFFTDEGAKDRARSFGFHFAMTLTRDDAFEGVESEEDVATVFRNRVRTGDVIDERYRKTLGEVFEMFEVADIERGTVLERVWVGFREALREDYLYELPEDNHVESIEERALA